jgi:transcription elongation factor Elf1
MSFLPFIKRTAAVQETNENNISSPSMQITEGETQDASNEVQQILPLPLESFNINQIREDYQTLKARFEELNARKPEVVVQTVEKIVYIEQTKPLEILQKLQDRQIRLISRLDKLSQILTTLTFPTIPNIPAITSPTCSQEISINIDEIIQSNNIYQHLLDQLKQFKVNMELMITENENIQHRYHIILQATMKLKEALTV